MPKPKIKQVTRVLNELRNGPATAREVAGEIRLEPRKVSFYLSKLREAGVVKIFAKTRTCEKWKFSNIYEIR